eukprot:GILK01009212.1.p1 GENE.GILK01009212.1~~GILK01009212.1.p1  ORF type:complete len:187 (+),score=20.18 GILK01009212.1:403-963(+)
MAVTAASASSRVAYSTKQKPLGKPFLGPLICQTNCSRTIVPNGLNNFKTVYWDASCAKLPMYTLCSDISPRCVYSEADAKEGAELEDVLLADVLEFVATNAEEDEEEEEEGEQEEGYINYKYYQGEEEQQRHNRTECHHQQPYPQQGVSSMLQDAYRAGYHAGFVRQSRYQNHVLQSSCPGHLWMH